MSFLPEIRNSVLFSPHKQLWLWDVLLEETFPVADLISSLLYALTWQSGHGQAATWERKITKCGEIWKYCQSNRMSFFISLSQGYWKWEGSISFCVQKLYWHSLPFLPWCPAMMSRWGAILGHITNFWLITLEPEFPRDVSWQLLQFLSELCLNYLFVHSVSLLSST